jgi:hypothetical protein
MRCIAAHGLLGLNEQGLTVTRQMISEICTFQRESPKAGSLRQQCHTRHQYDGMNECDRLSQYTENAQNAVGADQRHFDPFSRFELHDERHNGGEWKMSGYNGLAQLDERSASRS